MFLLKVKQKVFYIKELQIDVEMTAQRETDAETKKVLQAKLKEAGLPVQYQKISDTETLAKILSIVAQ